MLLDYFNIIIKNLRYRSVRSWLTLLGIFIGIAAVVSLISLGQGFENAIVGQFASVGTDKLTIQAQEVGFAPPGSTAVKRLTEEDVNAIRSVKGVKLVVARLLRSTTIEYNGKQRFGFLVSMPEKSDERKLVEESMKLKAEEGRLLRSGDKYNVVLGQYYKTNDYFGKKVKLGSKLKINGIEFSVAGFMAKMSNPQFNDIILMNHDMMKSTLNTGTSVDIAVAQVDNAKETIISAEAIKKELRKQRDVKKGKEDFKVETPQQTVATFTTVLGIIQAVIVGIAAISLVVGGIGIANTMFTSVLERRKEIGIMKAVGARNSSILLLFLLESGTLGLAGSVIGVVLGVLFAKTVETIGNVFLSEGVITASFGAPLIAGSLLFGFVVGSLSGIIPARQASMLPPVEALRK
jgi:putative ABC transport system permease protein